MIIKDVQDIPAVIANTTPSRSEICFCFVLGIFHNLHYASVNLWTCQMQFLLPTCSFLKWKLASQLKQ